ncbi:TKL protein kinase, partial [Phytophthora megakarya]
TIIRQSAASVPVVPGWFIPEHEVQREINHFAQGSFGKVYRGTWRNEKVVIKCVKEYSASSEQDFSREARVWLRAQHPNVVRFFGACHLARPCFFVCEEVTNGNLADFLKKTKGSDRSLTWRLLRGAALGLQCLHQNQIVHGDLKCNQILVSEDLTAKLTDFGMSFVSMKSRPATTSGAVRWKAPELLISEGKAPTFASDVYSFGMCVVEAVSGSVPWQAHLPNIAVVYHLTEKKKFLSRPIAFVNDEQWEFVLSLCSFDPSQRLCLGAAIEKIEKFVLHEEQAMKISAASIPYDRCITKTKSFEN